MEAIQKVMDEISDYVYYGEDQEKDESIIKEIIIDYAKQSRKARELFLLEKMKSLLHLDHITLSRIEYLMRNNQFPKFE